MRERTNATKVLAKRKIYETFISPGFYIAESIGLLLAYVLISGFVKSIDSGGFNFRLYPMYELIGRSLNGMFGAAFLEKLFAEGPFLFILYIAFLPVLLYLSISSVFKFGLEKKVGAIELITYGPADGTSYFAAGVIKDILFTILHILTMIIFLAIAAGINNLVLGPGIFLSFILVFILSIGFSAYGVFASTVSENPASAIAIFLGMLLFFFIILMGSFTIVSRYVQNLSSIFSWILKWLSPFYYWNLGLRAIEVGAWGMFFLSIILSLALSFFMLFISHVILRNKGVRA